MNLQPDRDVRELSCSSLRERELEQHTSPLFQNSWNSTGIAGIAQRFPQVVFGIALEQHNEEGPVFRSLHEGCYSNGFGIAENGEKGATRIRPATPRVPSPGCSRALDTGQAILIDRILGKLGILRCTEEHIRERSVRTLSHLQIAAEIDAAKDRETAEEGPGSSRDGRSPEDEAGRTESD